MPDLLSCKFCGLAHEFEPLPPGTVAKCRRCGNTIARHSAGSLHRTAAFALAALILYIPANTFPILQMDFYGATSQNTVWEGCVRLFQDGQWAVAVIVFLASILIPLLKLLGLFLLVTSTAIRMSRGKALRTWMYRFIDIIGRWAMLDVFVLAVLVSLVKLQRLATVIPGKGLIAFTAVVVLTILASASFDPELIWRTNQHSA
jgi:paraquat-inducible protein A